MHSVDEVARREGGYVNDPDDPGEATKYGMTIHTMRRLGLDLTGDGRVDAHEVKAFNEGGAVEIFKRHYYAKSRIEDLPISLRASVFDMYVNAGSNAVKILQRLLAKFCHPVTVDGQLGTNSIAAVKVAFGISPSHMVDANRIAWRNYYYALADRRAASRKYARTRAGGKGGRIRCAEEFIAEKYHLSLTDHKKRCAKWD